MTLFPMGKINMADPTIGRIRIRAVEGREKVGGVVDMFSRAAQLRSGRGVVHEGEEIVLVEPSVRFRIPAGIQLAEMNLQLLDRHKVGIATAFLFSSPDDQILIPQEAISLATLRTLPSRYCAAERKSSEATVLAAKACRS